jgi:outer membrane protein OmpA-like peptidoglycan-associated protein
VAVLLGVMSAFESDASRGAGSAAVPAAATTAATPPAVVSPAAQAAAPTSAAAAMTAPSPAKVYFEVNSFATPVDTNKRLSDLVTYSKSSSNSKLSISGFHDKTGDAAKNQELAKNRAKVVKDLLLSAGVPEDRIMMQKPTETTGGGDDKEARRVEVSAAQ